MTTIKDVARAAEVSVGTVSRVFNHHQNVAPEIRERVLQIASEMGYSGLAGQHSQSRTSARLLKEIAFLHSVDFAFTEGHTSLTRDPFWSRMLRGVENEARKKEVNARVTYQSIEDPDQILSLLPPSSNEKRRTGILLVTPHQDVDKITGIVRQVQSLNVPIVLIENCLPDQSVDCVLADNFNGARQVVDYLIDQGHRDIAFIGVPSLERPGRWPVCMSYEVNKREEGYRMALIDAGLPIKYELYEPGNLRPDGGYLACKRLLERRVEFSAIYCANDNTAIGAMKALSEAGLRIPQDVSLAGVDDIDISQHLSPPLTTVRYSEEALGAVAVKKLIQRASDPEAEFVTSLVRVELVKRGSVGPFKP